MERQCFLAHHSLLITHHCLYYSSLITHHSSLFYPLLISRRSHARAIFQLRSIVSDDTCKTSAISATVNPPKNFISTILHGRGSMVARFFSASSRATRFTSFCSKELTATPKDTRSAPPPRFAARRCNA